MRALFGHHCSSQTFRHDASMMPIFEARISTQQTQKRDGSESHSNTQSAQLTTQFETPPETTVSNIPAPVAASEDVGQSQVHRGPYVPTFLEPLLDAKQKQRKQPLGQSQLCKQFNPQCESTVLGVAERVVINLNIEESQVLPDAAVDDAEVGKTTVVPTGEQSAPGVAPIIPPELAVAAKTHMEDVPEQPRVLPDVKVDGEVEETVIIDSSGEECAPDPIPVVLPASAIKIRSPINEVSIPLASTGIQKPPLEKADTRPRKKQRYKNSTLAYMAGKSSFGEKTLLTWADFGGLVSTRTNAARQEDIL